MVLKALNRDYIGIRVKGVGFRLQSFFFVGCSVGFRVRGSGFGCRILGSLHFHNDGDYSNGT